MRHIFAQTTCALALVAGTASLAAAADVEVLHW